MNEEIKSIIEKNLPKQVGDTLREVLEQGQKDAEKVKSLLEDASNRDNTIERLTKEVNAYKETERLYNDLLRREALLAEGQRNLRITLLEFQNKELEKRSADMLSLVATLVKNPRAIELINQNQYGTNGYPDQYGGERQMSFMKNVNGSIEKQEIKED